jgi:hypothetical protein
MEAVVINNRVPEYLVKTAVSVGQRGNGEQGGKLARSIDQPFSLEITCALDSLLFVEM